MREIKGINLTETELEVLNKHRVIEFEAKRMLDPKSSEKDAEDIFYIIEKGGEIKAFMRLGKEKFRYEEKDFEMWSFSTLVAIEKNKGYGRQMLEELRRFSEESGESIVGFCLDDVKEYYLKNGLGILEGEENKYYYIDGEGKEVSKEYTPGLVIYINGADDFFGKLRSSQDRRVGLKVSWVF